MYIMQSITIHKCHLISLFAKPSEGVVRSDLLRGSVSLWGNACAYLGGWGLHDTTSIYFNGAYLNQAYARDF